MTPQTRNVGTKGGRHRVAPIDSVKRRELIERAKTCATTRSSSTSDQSKRLHQVKQHFYYVTRKHGLTRENRANPHRLRNEYANDRYNELTGVNSPARGGGVIDHETDRAARLIIAEVLGHGLESITTHYLVR